MEASVLFYLAARARGAGRLPADGERRPERGGGRPRRHYMSLGGSRRRGRAHDRGRADGRRTIGHDDRYARPPCRRRRGGRLPPPQGDRPRRVLGREREAGRGLLSGPVGLHPGRLRRPRDGGPRPRQLRAGAERHSLRLHRPADRHRGAGRARPPPRRRGARHRLRRRRRGVGLARDDRARRPLRAGADRAQGREGRAPPLRDPHLRRGAPLLHRPQRLPRHLRPRLPPHRQARPPRPPGSSCWRSTTASATWRWAT